MTSIPNSNVKCPFCGRKDNHPIICTVVVLYKCNYCGARGPIRNARWEDRPLEDDYRLTAEEAVNSFRKLRDRLKELAIVAAKKRLERGSDV